MSNYREMHLLPAHLYTKLMSMGDQFQAANTDGGKCLNINQLNSIQNEDGGKVFISQKPEVQSHTHFSNMDNSIKKDPPVDPANPSSNLNEIAQQQNNPLDKSRTSSHNGSFNLNTREKGGHYMEADIANASNVNDIAMAEPTKRMANNELSFVIPNKKTKKENAQSLISDIMKPTEPTEGNTESTEGNVDVITQPPETVRMDTSLNRTDMLTKSLPNGETSFKRNDRFSSTLPADVRFDQVYSSDDYERSTIDNSASADINAEVEQSNQQTNLNTNDSSFGRMDETELEFRPTRTSSPIRNGSFEFKPVKRTYARTKEDIVAPQKNSPAKNLKIARSAIEQKYRLSSKGKPISSAVLSGRPKYKPSPKPNPAKRKLEILSESDTDTGETDNEAANDTEDNTVIENVNNTITTDINNISRGRGVSTTIPKRQGVTRGISKKKTQV